MATAARRCVAYTGSSAVREVECDEMVLGSLASALRLAHALGSTMMRVFPGVRWPTWPVLTPGRRGKKERWSGPIRLEWEKAWFPEAPALDGALASARRWFDRHWFDRHWFDRRDAACEES
jgi:hypothetical protein